MIIDDFAIRSAIHKTENWPCEGQVYWDTSPIFSDPKLARTVTDALTQRFIDKEFDLVVGIESRGFLIASNLAYTLNLPLRLLRKAGHIPPPHKEINIDKTANNKKLEFATEHLTKGAKVLLCDDIIASGATLLGASTLLKECGASLLEAAAIAELKESRGATHLRNSDIAVTSLCTI